MSTNPTDIQKRIDEERKERERAAQEALERATTNTGLFGFAIPTLGGILGTDPVPTVDTSAETLAQVAPKTPTGSVRGLVTGEDQLLVDRALNPNLYPGFLEGLRTAGINPAYVQNVAKGGVPGTTLMDLNERFSRQYEDVTGRSAYSLRDLVRDTSDVDFVSAAAAVPGTPGLIGPGVGTITSDVLGDVYNLPKKAGEEAMSGGFGSAFGLLSDVLLMQSLLDNKPQAPAASAPRGIAGSRIPEEDPYKRRF